MPIEPPRASVGAYPTPTQRSTPSPTAEEPKAPAPATPPALSTAKTGIPTGTRQAAGAAKQLGNGTFHTPDWVKDSIFYQIFPDRFYNGDPGNDPFGTVAWGTKPDNFTFEGGDLEGVTQKLGYLKNLGVNALYMNPVFTSPSNHKYDTTDFEHVDPHFGGDAALKDMVDTAHDNGIKVILDGVLNHTSQQHPWFQDIRAKGAKSQYFDRYDVEHYPIRYSYDKNMVLRSPDYKSWWGFATLPVLQHDNPKVRDYFLNGPDSIVKRWIKDDKIDGWRMDSADEMSINWWQDARKAIKSANPNAYLTAEEWHDASKFLKGDTFDGAMNYQYFQQPATDFFAKKDIDSDQFVSRLQNNYPTEAKQAMLNLLDSHDTPRFLTQAGGDWYRLRPAAIFQMTYVGAPMIYYGDEVAMEGATDPDSRRAFPWERVDPNADAKTGHGTLASGAGNGAGRPPGSVQQAPSTAPPRQIHDLYQKLIGIRKEQPALRRGDFRVLETHNTNKTLAFRRSMAGQRDAIVAINNDVVGHDIVVPTQGTVANGTGYTDALSGKHYTVNNGQIVLPNINGNFGVVLLADKQPAQSAHAHARDGQKQNTSVAKTG